MDEREGSARSLFPDFPRIADLFALETEGLPEESLLRVREEKSWGLWSIQDQTSHVASLPYRWLLVRWGGVLFGGALPRERALLERFDGRMMKREHYPRIGQLLDAMRDSFALAWEVLGAETPESLRDGRRVSERAPKGMKRPGTGEDVREWRERVTLKAHPDGAWTDPDDPDLFHFSLEYTFRHLLWEAYAHLKTIQMHKKAEGRAPRAAVPQGGYLAVLRWE